MILQIQFGLLHSLIYTNKLRIPQIHLGLLHTLTYTNKLRIPQIQFGLLHTLTYTNKLRIPHIQRIIANRLKTKPYDKSDDFNVPIVNFPPICISSSCIWTLPFSVHIYSGSCALCKDFIIRKQMNLWFLVEKLEIITSKVDRSPSRIG